MRHLRVLTLLFLVAAPLRAQVIIGTVTDSLSGAPIGGATLSLQDSTGALIWEARSDSTGAFRMDGKRVGSMRFTVRKIGAQPSVSPLYEIPTTADTVQVDLVAPIVGVTLATVTVVSSSRPRLTFNARQLINAKESGWHVVDPWRIAAERDQSSSFAQLLRRSPLPGVRAPRNCGRLLHQHAQPPLPHDRGGRTGDGPVCVHEPARCVLRGVHPGQLVAHPVRRSRARGGHLHRNPEAR